MRPRNISIMDGSEGGDARRLGHSVSNERSRQTDVSATPPRSRPPKSWGKPENRNRSEASARCTASENPKIRNSENRTSDIGSSALEWSSVVVTELKHISRLNHGSALLGAAGVHGTMLGYIIVSPRQLKLILRPDQSHLNT
ncbi:uncharacterized protein Dere_GG26883 [Drosophila erecta]|uniref:Uncharacterized protein n=1 Tax=Drosophila erecta TaxID=7220 RepID=A0A0Q5U4L9_DROER|nr:uncharacterized protein Dere_GG26883 [Drosophila erecta]